MIKIQKKANFWIRLLATFIDCILFLSIATGTSFLVFNYKTGNYFYRYNYYFWLLFLSLYLAFFFIVLPIIWKGKTIGMAICRIMIIKQFKEDKLPRVIFDRQRLFSFLWIIILLSFMIFIHPDTFLEAIQGKTLKTYQRAFLIIPTVLSSLALITDIFFISSNLRANRIGLNDKLSRTFTIWINKFEFVEAEDKEEIFASQIKLKPRILPNIKIEN